MAIAKVILNGETLMDVTSDTAEAGKMLSGIKATKNDGTKVTGNIASKSSTDLTVSGATVTAPAGYYSANVSKAIASGSAKTPATTITANPSVSIDSDGLITATVSGSKSITPTVSAGYVSSGTAGTVSVSGSGTKQLTSRTSADLTTSGATVTVPAGYYPNAASKSVSATTHPKPTASIANNTGIVTASHTQNTGYVTGGTTTGTLQLTTQGAQTITPGTSNQTIAANRWLTGAQTIAGDANLVAENIAEGISIFGIAGTHSGGSSNFISGAFHTSSTTGIAQTVDLPYTGTGYPIIAYVEISDGLKTIYDSGRRYAVGCWCASKTDKTTAPRYRYDYASVFSLAGASYTGGFTEAHAVQNYYTAGGAEEDQFLCIAFTSATTLSVYVSEAGKNGLVPDTDYTYFILYSE